MRLWRENLLLQFSITSLVVMTLLGIFLSLNLANSARQQVINEAAAEAKDTLSQRVLRQLNTNDMDKPMTGERLQIFHRFVADSVVSERTARIKLWSRQGQLIYSDDFSQIGQSFPIESELAEALRGQIGQEISVPDKVENERERYLGTLIEVYVPVIFPGTTEVRGAFEIYQYYAPFVDFITRQRYNIFIAISASFAILYLALFYIVFQGWREIRNQQRRAERSLQEVTALNNLLRGYLEQRQRFIEDVQQLSTQAGLPPQSDGELRGFYVYLRERLRQLAEEASGFPSPTPPTST